MFGATLLSGYGALACFTTGVAALLDKSKHDKAVGLLLLAGAAGFAKLTYNLT